jgi:hypothetical protein
MPRVRNGPGQRDTHSARVCSAFSSLPLHERGQSRGAAAAVGAQVCVAAVGPRSKPQPGASERTAPTRAQTYLL